MSQIANIYLLQKQLTVTLNKGILRKPSACWTRCDCSIGGGEDRVVAGADHLAGADFRDFTTGVSADCREGPKDPGGWLDNQKWAIC